MVLLLNSFDNRMKKRYNLGMGDKRNRPPVPTYIKFYSVDKYDRLKFRELLNEWLKTDEGKNRTLLSLKNKQDEIVKKCLEKDSQGNTFKASDEQHIYRIRTLHNIYERIYDYVIMYYMFNGLEVKGLNINPDEKEAELKNTWKLSLNTRIRIHIRLLRLLKAGYQAQEAIEALKNGEYKQFRELQREQINKQLCIEKGLI